MMMGALAEAVTLQLTTIDGDAEDVIARESAPDSGVFYAAIATSALPPPLRIGDCRLSLRGDDMIAIVGPQEGQPVTGLTGHVHVLADPFGMVLLSRDGSPVSGARVTLGDMFTVLGMLLRGALRKLEVLPA